jgi:phenylacetate-CoA ligase
MDRDIEAFLAALDQTQYYPPDKLRAYQRRLLDKLVRHARAEAPAYTDRLSPLFRSDDSIDWDRWTEIPVLTRAVAQENAADLKARNVPPVAGQTRSSRSSGSTGRPFLHFSSELQHVGSACANERFFRWHGIDPKAQAARIAIISSADTAYPEGRRRRGWRIANPDSILAELNVSTPIVQQVEWLHRIKPQILISYPGNLLELGRVATEEGTSLRFDAVLSVGETLRDDMREEILRLLGTPPLDRYGTTEVSHTAAACPHSGKHHVASELVLLEIVDESGTPVADGQEGRIVITAFYNFAMPFIRYDTGDIGMLAAGPCGCGRTLPVLERIFGRARSIFRFRDGSRIWPHLRSSMVNRFVPNRQFQVVQTAIDRIELRYVPASSDQVIDPAGLTAYAKESLHPSIEVDLVAVERFDRLPSGKFEGYLSVV